MLGAVKSFHKTWPGENSGISFFLLFFFSSRIDEYKYIYIHIYMNINVCMCVHMHASAT